MKARSIQRKLIGVAARLLGLLALAAAAAWAGGRATAGPVVAGIPIGTPRRPPPATPSPPPEAQPDNTPPPSSTANAPTNAQPPNNAPTTNAPPPTANSPTTNPPTTNAPAPTTNAPTTNPPAPTTNAPTNTQPQPTQQPNPQQQNPQPQTNPQAQPSPPSSENLPGKVKTSPLPDRRLFAPSGTTNGSSKPDGTMGPTTTPPGFPFGAPGGSWAPSTGGVSGPEGGFQYHY